MNQENPSDSSLSSDSSTNDDIILIYPSNGPSPITINLHHMNCLKANEYINDVIIAFYARYIYEEIMDDRKKSTIHIFDSLFFEKLLSTAERIKTMDSVQQKPNHIKRWVKNINLDKKTFLLFPANVSYHWFLIVLVCLEDKPIVAYILNSMNTVGESYSSNCFLKRTVEVSMKMFVSVCLNKNISIRFEEVRVPKQRNYTDCGLFVLEYMRLIAIDNPFENYEQRVESLRFWFDPKCLTCTRRYMHSLIMTISHRQN